MASDQLRKKWGTIFMGEREATPQQLDAMQEPVLRERMQHQQQEDYLARVRARAEERAREILGAAYAERQKVLEEARTEAEARVRQLTENARALKARAQAELAEAEAERGQARDLRQEAENIRQGAHTEGFQAGMDQAGEELKEFRAEVGQMLANLLRAMEAQRGSLVEDWREHLAELTRVAVEAGTGWVLETEHKRILRNLVFASLQLLEDRATVSIRVHPDDEETVGDLFRAARERVPELSQWIVNGDETLEPGDLVAESLSGSVENLRAHFREMVDGILEHLTLPQSPGEERAGEAAAAVAQRGLDRLAELEPSAAPVVASATDPASAESADEGAQGVEPGVDDGEPLLSVTPETAPADPAAEAAGHDAEPPTPATAGHDAPVSGHPSEHLSESAAGSSHDSSAEAVGAPFAAAVAEPEMNGLEPGDAVAEAHAAGHEAPHADSGPEVAPELAKSSAQGPAQAPAPEFSPEASVASVPDREQAHPSPEPAATPAPGASSGLSPELAPDRAASAAPVHEPAAEAAPNPPADNPSLAELEDELFPLPGEDDAAATRASDSVFVNGGFLPGADDGRTE